MSRERVQLLVPPATTPTRSVPYPDYLRELREHWLCCARQARAEAQRRRLVDPWGARKIQRAFLQAVLFARRVNRELVSIRRSRP